MIGIIAAMQCELDRLVEETENAEEKEICSITYYRGKLRGKDVVMAVSGEGKVNAAVCAQTMILLYRPERIINTGVAGSLSPTLHIGDLAIATATAQHDYDLSPLGVEKSFVFCGRKTPDCDAGDKATVLFPTDETLVNAIREAAEEERIHAECGIIVSGDQFISSDALKKDFCARFHPAKACEMESGAIAQVCRVAGVPFGVIRVMSDNADDATVFSPIEAAKHSTAVTLRVLEKLGK